MLRRSFLLFAYTFSLITCFAQGTWTQKANLPAAGRLTSFAFDINSKGYIGTGWDGTNIFDDLWEYDPSTNSWTQKANYPGGPVAFSIGFSIGNKGYAGISYSFINEFWEYDPPTNSWAQKASMPGGGVCAAGAFVVGGKGYVTTGSDITNSSQGTWEYTPSSNSWAQKTNFPIKRSDVDRAPFVINGKAYVGTGLNYTTAISNSIVYNDLWEYNPASNAWTQKANLPGVARCGATGFSICYKGFLGLGAINDSTWTVLNDFWMYDPSLNSWSTVTTFPGTTRVDAASFVLNDKAYIFGGSDNWNVSYNDLWEFIPAGGSGGTPPIITTSGNTTICIGDTAHITASGGGSYLWSTGEMTSSISVSPSITTTYSLVVSDGCSSASVNVTVSVVQSGTASFLSSYDPCLASCVQFVDQSIDAGSWLWDFGDGATGNGNTTCHDFGGGSGTYTVSLIINNSTTCADTIAAPVTYEEKKVSTDIYIPNAFSPNDDGENDALHFYLESALCIKYFYIAIYNYWGEKVFESSDLSKGWDGTYNGEKENSGVYTYYLDVTLQSDKKMSKKGNISLLR